MFANAQTNCMQDQQFKEDLTKLLDYVYYDEKKHYMEWPARKHIYLVIRRLAKQVGYVKR